MARVERLYKQAKKRKEDLSVDVNVATSDYTKQLLNEKMEESQRDVEKYKKELQNWTNIKEAIQNGKTYTCQQAKNIAKSRSY